jgi:NADPH:quinone reductase-like Zn-dependent oxidoreductase
LALAARTKWRWFQERDRASGLAQYAVVNEEAVVHVPGHLSFEAAATLPCAAVTTWAR